jgi:hypothetical protein
MRQGDSRLRVNRAFCGFILAILTISQAAAQQPDPQPPVTSTSKKASFKDHTDGWFDLSEFLEKPGGFFPLVMPITEPAVGYGLAVFPIFVRPREDVGAQGYSRPNITTAGGLFTSNGSWGLFGGDSTIWRNGAIETLFAGGYGSINLKYYDDAGGRKGAPALDYKLKIAGGVARSRFRIRKSKFYVGLRYLYLQADASAKSQSSSVTPPPRFGQPDRIAGPSLFLTYDSRDNILTPTKGLFTETTYSYFDPIFGGTMNYRRFDQLGIAYIPLHPRLTLGIYGNTSFTFGNPVFYARPYVSLRGIPALRYQRQNLAESEMELRWQFWERFSVVGFGGPAVVWNSSGPSSPTVATGAGGLGVRYLLARKFGLHYGIDVARGPEGSAIYFQFGSAWMRP